MLNVIAGTHPLLQQTPLTLNPFIDLPKAPTLPPSYASLPSTLPASALQSPPAQSAPDLPAYVLSQGGYAAHPSAVRAQNKDLLRRLEEQGEAGRKKVEEWEKSIQERELAERRRRAPGWLDREERLLEPEKAGGSGASDGGKSLMDEEQDERARSVSGIVEEKEVEDLGKELDRAFGRSEMGS